jgi:Uma2 family endonuclease
VEACSRHLDDLDAIMSTAPHRRLTEAEYLMIERAAVTKSDFYAGEMYAMAGAKRNHNLIVANVIRQLGNQLERSACEVYPSDMRVKVAKSGLFTYPDVIVACGHPEFLDEKQDTLLNPTLLVEVLSTSTASYDRGFKTSRYRLLPSLREYLLIEQDQPLVELYRRANRNKWELEDASELTAKLTLESIGCELTLEAIYERIVFETTDGSGIR